MLALSQMNMSISEYLSISEKMLKKVDYVRQWFVNLISLIQMFMLSISIHKYRIVVHLLCVIFKCFPQPASSVVTHHNAISHT